MNDHGISFASESVGLSNDAEIAAASEVARLVYGAIGTESPHWQTCLEVVRTLGGAVTLAATPEHKTDSAVAYMMCKEFNKTYPPGTDGVLNVEHGQVILTKIEKAAVVFPNPAKGTTTMAFFLNAGWRDIKDFSKDIKVPTMADELVMIGHQIKTQGREELAHAIYRAALAEDPTNFHALNEQGVYLAARNRFEEALERYNGALKKEPNTGGVYNNRAMTLRALGRGAEAVADCRKAMELLPDEETIAMNMASALDDMGETAEALRILDARLLLYPKDYGTHYNRALMLLSAARMLEGWLEFPWRLLQPQINSHYEHYDIPRWTGEDLIGKSVLVWAEQGLGDEIMTASMIRDLIPRCLHVTLLCTDRLVPLFQRSFPTITVGQRPSAAIVDLLRREPLRQELVPTVVRNGKFDVQMSQGDLGLLFRQSTDLFPKHKGFLHPDAATASQARYLVKSMFFPNQKVVGISWHSRGNTQVGRLKSLELKDLAPIFKVPGITFVNLQYGDMEKEIAEFRESHGVEIQEPAVNPLENMDDFAGLVAAMDLVITVSNTTAHVAGALNVPCWVLTPTGPGKLWYWLRNREDSPWYPSVKLFRQPCAAHWDEPINRVAAELATWASTEVV